MCGTGLTGQGLDVELLFYAAFVQGEFAFAQGEPACVQGELLISSEFMPWWFAPLW